MNITKDILLISIEEEELGWGSWMGILDHTSRSKISSGECIPCAIGSAIKHYKPNMKLLKAEDKLDSQTLGRVAPYQILPVQSFLPENWLSRISFVWESMRPEGYRQENIGIRKSSEEAKEHLIDWIEKNVPEDEILFTI